MNEFRIEHNHAIEFRRLMDAIGEVVEQATFTISSKSVRMSAMGPAHVCMIILNLPQGYFDELFCPESVELKIDLIELNKVLAKAGDEPLAISPDKENNKLCVTLTNDIRRIFRIGLFSEEIEPPPIPVLSYKAEFSIPTEILRKIVVSSALVGDYITFSISGETDTLTTITEDENNDVTIDFDGFLLETQISGTQTAKYSLEYFNSIIKATKVAEQVNMAFSTEMPIKLEFPLRNNGKLTYILSPRVEEEEAEEFEEAEVEHIEHQDGKG